jgi:hypothetical protein
MPGNRPPFTLTLYKNAELLNDKQDSEDDSGEDKTP